MSLLKVLCLQLDQSLGFVCVTCEEDDVSLLNVLCLQLEETVQVGGGARWSVTLMVWQELHNVFLLVRGQQVQDLAGFTFKPDGDRDEENEFNQS